MSIKRRSTPRKTFAIISPPGCWETTITEQLLLYGAIRQAGTVEENREV